MKSLARTVDRLLKVEPSLKKLLLPLKDKSIKYPSRRNYYWKKLLSILNAPDMMEHPRRSEIKGIVVVKPKTVKKLSSFESLRKGEKITGIIPENIADKIRRHDGKTIESAKKRVEASMTRDTESLTQILRQDTLMDINMKKTWAELKDIFNLWAKPSYSFGIRKKGPFLVVVETQQQPQPYPQQAQNNVAVPGGLHPNMGVVKLDPESMRKFFELLGMDPPPEEEGDEEK